MITVVVPVLNQIQITDKFLGYIAENVVLPEEIILVDNGSTEKIGKLVKKYNKKGKLRIRFIRHKRNIGVNAAWNEGIKLAKTSLISILNNDIILNKYFFKKIIEASQVNEKYGIFCVTNAKKIERVGESKDIKIKIANMGKREGWAFTIRKEITDRLPPIPPDLRIYCGDDFLYYGARTVLGYQAVRIMNNYIFHLGGRTIISNKKQFKGVRKREKVIWNKKHKPKLLKLKGKI